MRITDEKKNKLEAQLPSAESTREKLLAYKAHGDLTWEQVAVLCGRRPGGLVRFAKDKYEQTADSDLNIRRDIEGMFVRYPVAITQTDQGELYETENVATIRRWFHHCQANRAMAVIYGPPGSQKTFVVKRLVAEFNQVHLRREGPERAFYIRSSINMRPRDLLRRICHTTGAPAGQTTLNCLNGLRLSLGELHVLLVIDETQLLTLDSLEILRELHDPESGIRTGVLLLGSHELARTLDQKAHQLEQWNSRIDARIALEGVSFDTAAGIVRRELSDLSLNKTKAVVDASRVPDLYRGGDRYINVRRLFKNIKSTRAVLAQKEVTQ